MDRETSAQRRGELKALRVAFGARLTKLRSFAGFSIGDLARFADLPVELLENVEAGRCSLSVEALYDIAAQIGTQFLLADDTVVT